MECATFEAGLSAVRCWGAEGTARLGGCSHGNDGSNQLCAGPSLVRGVHDQREKAGTGVGQVNTARQAQTQRCSFKHSVGRERTDATPR